MKMTCIISSILLLLVLGCKREAKSPPAQITTVSNGGFTFYTGKVTMNGTNVPMTNVTFTALPDTNN
jgi:hypothetical protein